MAPPQIDSLVPCASPPLLLSRLAVGRGPIDRDAVTTPQHREAPMLVPFGTRVVDSAGHGVGTVRRLILHRDSQEVAGLVVHQGVLNRREIVVPITKVAAFGTEVRLQLSAAELAGLDLFQGEALQAIPDHWAMPAG